MSQTAQQIFAAIRTLAFAQRAAGDDWARESGLTRAQGFTLAYIQAHEERGVIARELADMSGTTPAAVTSLLQGLEERGLVTRVPSPRDSRVKLISITRAGTALIDGFDDAIVAADEELLAALDAAEQERLRALLERAVAGLGDRTPRAPEGRPRPRARTDASASRRSESARVTATEPARARRPVRDRA